MPCRAGAVPFLVARCGGRRFQCANIAILDIFGFLLLYAIWQNINEFLFLVSDLVCLILLYKYEIVKAT